MLEHLPALNRTANPLCSVCIANYNGAKTLNNCIKSVLDQDCDFEIEIIIHDDASTDHSIDDIQDKYPNVELLIGKENKGFCVSNNRMADIARGKFLLLLNNDAVLFPDALKTLEQGSRKQSPQGILGLPQYDMSTGELIDRGSMFDLFLNTIPNMNENRKNVGMVMGACLWIPRKLWYEIGGFPNWFQSMAEDMLVCCAARLMSIPVQVLPSSGFRHVVGQSFGGGKVIENKLITSSKRRSLSERNKIFVMILSFPAIWLIFCLPLHYLLLSIEGVLLSVYRKRIALWTQIYWPALAAPLKYRHQLFSKRRMLQRLRTASLKDFLAPQVRWFHKLYMLRKFGVPQIHIK